MGPEEWRDLGGDRPTETTVLRIERDAAVARADHAEAQAYDLRLALAREILDAFGVPYGTEDVRDAARRIVGDLGKTRGRLAQALARAETAERDLHALRAGVAEGRATMDRLALLLLGDE